jgi:hypothetical protein
MVQNVLDYMLTLGTKEQFKIHKRMTTDTLFHVHRILTNAPCESFVRITSIKVEGIDRLVIDFDAFYADQVWSRNRAVETIVRGDEVEIVGEYSGLVPGGYRSNKYQFLLSPIGEIDASADAPLFQTVAEKNAERNIP